MPIGFQDHPLQGLAFRSAPSQPTVGYVAPEPDLVIHTLDDLMSDVRRRRGPVGTAVSLATHAALLAGMAGLSSVTGRIIGKRRGPVLNDSSGYGASKAAIVSGDSL